MRTQGSGSRIAAGLCVAVALLRMLAPSMPFDWMTLALVALAALSLMLPEARARRCHAHGPCHVHSHHAPHPGVHPDEENAPVEQGVDAEDEVVTEGAEEAELPHSSAPAQNAHAPLSIAPLQERMERLGWATPGGELYEALCALHAGDPFAAMCAARGMLALLTSARSLAGDEAETLVLLMAALDTCAHVGVRAVSAESVSALFACALRALGRLETAQ